MALLYVVLGSILAVYLGWYWFVAAMGFKAAKDTGKLTRNTIIAAYPGIIVGYLYDVIVLNVIGSIYLLDFPRIGEWTLTAHLTRLKNAPGIKGHKARVICKNMLDPFELGGHCK
jgi:hypothetical protein